MIRKYYKLLSLLVLITSCKDAKVGTAETKEAVLNEGSYTSKTLEVYTTARDTELRLAKTNQLEFKNKVQPLETEIAIFVNTKKTFQKYLGIGGAINGCFS